MARTIPITLYVLVEEDGTETVLWDCDELEERQQQIEEGLASAARLKAAKTEREQMMGAIREQEWLTQQARLETIRERLPALRQQAQVRTFNCVVPRFGEYLDAEREANVLQEDSTVLVDNNRLMATLLPKSIQGVAEEQFEEDISPHVGEEIWKRFFPKIRPNKDRVFFSPRLSSTSVAAS